MCNVVPSIFLFLQNFVVVCQRLLAYGVGGNNACTLLICCEIPPIGVVGVMHLFFIIMLLGLSFIFKR